MSKMRRRIYLDTNILIYAVDGDLLYRAKVQDMLNELEPDTELISSELTLGECLRGALRRGNQDSAEGYRHLLLDRDFITLAPVTLPIIERAAQLGAEMNMRLIDALHMATAEALACTVFMTNDRGIRAPAGVSLQHLEETNYSPPPSP
jgi:predicted nucleic acid-binding protein